MHILLEKECLCANPYSLGITGLILLCINPFLFCLMLKYLSVQAVYLVFLLYRSMMPVTIPLLIIKHDDACVMQQY